MESEPLTWKEKGLLFFGGFVFFTVLGWLTDDPNKKNSTSKRKTKEELSKLPPKEQQAYIEEQLSKMTPQEQQDYIQELMQPQESSSGSQVEKLFTAAETAKSRGKFAEAEKCYLQLLDIFEEDPSLGSEHIYAGVCLYNLAMLYFEKQDFTSTETYFLKALPILRKEAEKPIEQGPLCVEHCAEAQSTLAKIYSLQEKYDKAEPLLVEATKYIEKREQMINMIPTRNETDKKLKEELLQKAEKELAMMVDDIAKIKFKQEKYEEAEKKSKEALELLIGAFGKKSDASIKARIRIAQILLYLNRPSEANEYYDEIIQVQGSVNGSEKIEIATLQQFFGQTLFEKGFFEEGEKRYQEALEVLEQCTPREEKQINLLMDSIACSLRERGKQEEANEMLKQLTENLNKSKIDPPLSSSKYLRTTTSKVSFEAKETQKPVPYFSITLETKKEKTLEEGSVLEFTFENPVEEGEPIVVEHVIKGETKSFTVVSPHLEFVKPQTYQVKIAIYSDQEKTEQIGAHHAWCQSRIESTNIETIQDLFKASMEGNN